MNHRRCAQKAVLSDSQSSLLCLASVGISDQWSGLRYCGPHSLPRTTPATSTAESIIPTCWGCWGNSSPNSNAKCQQGQTVLSPAYRDAYVRTVMIDQCSHSDTIHEKSIIEILDAILFDQTSWRCLFAFHVCLKNSSKKCHVSNVRGWLYLS